MPCVYIFVLFCCPFRAGMMFKSEFIFSFTHIKDSDTH